MKDCVTANSDDDFLSSVRSMDWDDEVIVPLRRSKRAKKRYPYRGIEDFVSWNETDVDKDNQTDEVFNDNHGQAVDNEDVTVKVGKKTRTLTEASNLDEVVKKGEQSKKKRNTTRVRDPAEISLPSSFAQNFDDVLLPRRPIVPEQVQTDTWQFLESALNNLPLVPRPGVREEDVAACGGGDDGGTGDEGDGPPEEGGVRQFHI